MWRFTKRVLSNRRVRVWLGVVGLFALVVIGAAGWHVKDATDPARVEPIALPGDLVFADGDIILAGGVSLQSRAVTALVGGERYSHVGLIELTEDGPMVLHASPRGAGDGGVGDRVARLPLAVFLCERGYVAVRVLRLRPSEADAEATSAIPAEAARIAGDYGYDEINLNVGCPSDRVQSGAFGACLMRDPALVARCVSAMIEASQGPEITVKCRIGVDDQDPEIALRDFIGTVSDAGVRSFAIHARKAWLEGLSPKQNRTVISLWIKRKLYTLQYRSNQHAH